MSDEQEQPDLCRCHRSFAAVAPWHPGHCCFVPAGSTCHEREVAEWEQRNAEQWGRT